MKKLLIYIILFSTRASFCQFDSSANWLRSYYYGVNISATRTNFIEKKNDLIKPGISGQIGGFFSRITKGEIKSELGVQFFSQKYRMTTDSYSTGSGLYPQNSSVQTKNYLDCRYGIKLYWGYAKLFQRNNSYLTFSGGLMPTIEAYRKYESPGVTNKGSILFFKNNGVGPEINPKFRLAVYARAAYHCEIGENLILGASLHVEHDVLTLRDESSYRELTGSKALFRSLSLNISFSKYLTVTSTSNGYLKSPKSKLLRHAVYLELFGSGLDYSLNYEYVLNKNENFNIRLRAGFCYLNSLIFNLPANVSMVFGRKILKGEFGLGHTLYLRQDYLQVHNYFVLLGLRWETNQNSIFRITLTPIAEIDFDYVFVELVPKIGFSFGKKF